MVSENEILFLNFLNFFVFFSATVHHQKNIFYITLTSLTYILLFFHELFFSFFFSLSFSSFFRRCRELKEAYRQRPGIEQKRRNQERLRKIRAKKDRLATEERTIKYEESLVRNERSVCSILLFGENHEKIF